MHFVDLCKARLTPYFGLSEQQLRAERLVIDTDGSSLHVEFNLPADTVSVYSRSAGLLSEQLPLPEHYLLLQRALETCADLYERSLLRLYLDEGCFGLVINCSPLNCAGADDFMAALQALLDCKKILDHPVV